MKKNLVRLMLIGVVPLLTSMEIGTAEAGAADLGQQLVEAIQGGDAPQALRLIASGADVGASDSMGYPVLILSINYDSLYDFIDVVKALIKKGADVNKAESESGYTPLMVASELGREAIVKFLLEHGADSFVKLEGKTALDLAKTEKIKAMLQEHMKKIKRETKAAILEAQPEVPEDILDLIVDFAGLGKTARSSIEDVD